MEVIDIGLSDLEPISVELGDSGPKPSVNFGPGIELLMNDKKRASSSNITMDLGELDNLENELNALSGASMNPPSQSSNSSFFGGGGGGETKTLTGFASNLFGYGSTSTNKTLSSTEPNDSNLGQATAETVGNSKTWDGYSKISEVPLSGSSAPKMTDREKRRKKRAMIKKLEEWYEKGLIKHSSHFNMDSVYEEIEDEYETALEDKRKKDSVKLQGWWFMTFINSVEYANSTFNPFDLNLDGWGEQVSEDIDSYEEIFSELHEKYKGGKLSPEISLLLRLGFSAAVVNITNKALSSATPGFNDVIRQSPELMKMFTNATVQSMSQQSPGFAFANNMANPTAPSTSYGAPPAPVETKGQPGPPRPGMQYTQHPGNRPDISAGRGAMFREGGIDLNDKSPARPPQQQQQQQQPSYMQGPRSEQPPPQQRNEMRGPQNTDINNILAGLKTREVMTNEPVLANEFMNDDNDSLVSIGSVKDMQNASMPKRANRRKQRSDKNIVSLDI